MPLSNMIMRLRQARQFEDAIQTILNDVMALLGAEHGNVQLLIGNELAIVAQHGFSAPFLIAFARVKKGDGSACARALESGEQIVIMDVRNDPNVEFRNVAEEVGFRSVQSTPLLTTRGEPIGIVSTHFTTMHVPTLMEMRTLKEYSGHAADQLRGLLGSTELSVKAQELNQKLYTRLGVEIHSELARSSHSAGRRSR